MAGGTCTFALKIAGTSNLLAVLQLFAALYVVFSGMSLKKVGVLLFCQYASTNQSFQLSLVVTLFTEQKHLVCS
jgi:hypothetical protein